MTTQWRPPLADGRLAAAEREFQANASRHARIDSLVAGARALGLDVEPHKETNMQQQRHSTLTARQRLFAGVFGATAWVDDARHRQHGATTITNDRVLDDARVGFTTAFLDAFAAGERLPIEALATESQSKQRVQRRVAIVDIPGMEEWIGDRTLRDLEALELPPVRARKWQSGFRVKGDDFADDNLGLLPQATRGLTARAREHRGKMIIELLLNGFDGTAFPDLGDGLAFDGEFFFSVDHETGSNLITDVFGATGVDKAARLIREQQRLDLEESLLLRPSHLVVGPKNEAAAIKFLTQEALVGGESNTNRGRYELIVEERLRDAFEDYWFLGDLTREFKPVELVMREEISTQALTSKDSVPVFQFDELWFGAKARYNVGYLEHRVIVGSTGAGA